MSAGRPSPVWFCLCLFALAACGDSDPVPKSPTAVTPPTPAPIRFQLPTANRALFDTGGEPRFFTATGPDYPWSSGAFGCVRNSGTRFHEGIDIQCLSRDTQGEPLDAVHCAAPGRVAFVNRAASASDYGQYIVVLHEIDQLTIYTLYAHLREIHADIRPQSVVQAGQTVGTLGRSAKYPIARERAHLHFEIGLLGSSHFDACLRHWYKDPGPNPFGNWNGQNLLGLDPAALLLKQNEARAAFSLRSYITALPALCTVRIHKSALPLAERYPALLAAPALATTPVAYEVDLNPQGVPLRIRALASGVVKPKTGAYELIAVDEALEAQHRCSKLVLKKGRAWTLTDRGQRALDLFAYVPGA